MICCTPILQMALWLVLSGINSQCDMYLESCCLIIGHRMSYISAHLFGVSPQFPRSASTDASTVANLPRTPTYLTLQISVRDPDLLPFSAYWESQTPQSLSFLLASNRMFKEQLLRNRASEILTVVCATNLSHIVPEIPKHPLV